jgi:hypothetical protein
MEWLDFMIWILLSGFLQQAFWRNSAFRLVKESRHQHNA